MAQVVFHRSFDARTNWLRILDIPFTGDGYGPGWWPGRVLESRPDYWVLAGNDGWTVTLRPPTGAVFAPPPEGGRGPVGLIGSLELRDAAGQLVMTVTGLAQDGRTFADLGAFLDTDDTVQGSAGQDVLLGGDGDDFLWGGGGDDQLLGGSGRDTAVYAGPRSQYEISYWGGTVTISGLEGVDRLEGVEFARFADLTVALAPPTIDGTVSDDVLFGTSAAETLQGLAGDDTLYALAGHDTLYGGAGDDVLEGGEGDDYLDGGDGTDTAAYDFGGLNPAPGGVVFNAEQVGLAGTVVLADGLGGLDTLVSIERVRAKGTDAADTLVGSQGDDLLMGRGGDDLLIGGDGDDVIHPGGGSDRVEGGRGWDEVVFDFASTDFVMQVAGDRVVLKRGGETDELYGVERLRFTDRVIDLGMEVCEFPAAAPIDGKAGGWPPPLADPGEGFGEGPEICLERTGSSDVVTLEAEFARPLHRFLAGPAAIDWIW